MHGPGWAHFGVIENGFSFRVGASFDAAGGVKVMAVGGEPSATDHRHANAWQAVHESVTLINKLIAAGGSFNWLVYLQAGDGTIGRVLDACALAMREGFHAS